MKKRILIVIIYFTGYVFAYKYTKFNFQRDKINKEWTKGDRRFSLLLSGGSWLTVASMGIIHGISSFSNDEKAEW